MTSGACTTLHALLCLDDGGFATVTIINLKPSRRMFNEVPSCGIRAELNATGIHAPTLPWGVQPRNQLSLDFPMVENCARTTATRSSCVALLLAAVGDDYDNHRRGPTCVALCCVLQTVASRFSSTATWTPEPPHGTETCGTATRFRWWLIWRRRNPLSTSQAPANKPGPSRAPCAASRRRPRKRGWGLSRCVNINLTCSVDLHHLPFDPFTVRPLPLWRRLLSWLPITFIILVVWQANIFSTIDWCLNTWGINPFPGGLSPLTIPAARFGHQTRALLPALQSPFGGVLQPTIELTAQSWQGPDDDVNPGAIKAQAWRANLADNSSGQLCIVVAMVNTMDCTTAPQERFPLVKCKPNSTYPGFVDFVATVRRLLPRNMLGTEEAPLAEMKLKQIFVFSSGGLPLANRSVPVRLAAKAAAAAEFGDRVGAGETNLYQLEAPPGACDTVLG